MYIYTRKLAQMIHDTQSAQISQKQYERNINVIMKTMCPLRYHHNGFMATHALGHMMYVMRPGAWVATKPLW